MYIHMFIFCPRVVFQIDPFELETKLVGQNMNHHPPTPPTLPINVVATALLER